MVIPQGMSYAQNLAYLPQVYGLYGSFVPCEQKLIILHVSFPSSLNTVSSYSSFSFPVGILYGLLGSSRQLVVGPVAVTSLLLGSGLSGIFGNFQINPSDPGDALEQALQDRYNRGAIQVAFIAGLIYTVIGILRCGWIINFLSIPVISGFMTGAAMIILTGQIKYITGQKLPRSDTMYENLVLVFSNLNLFKWREFVMGGSFIILLLVLRYLSKRYKRLGFLQFAGPLSVCVISIIIMNVWKLYVFNPEIPGTPYIKPVGYIPKGMPQVTVSWWFPLYDVSKQMVLSILVCLLDIVESTSIARSLAVKNKYKLDGTQEM
jgi:sulfate transporter 4